MLKIELLGELAIPTLGIHPREMQTYVHTKTGMGMFTAALFVYSKMETNQLMNE